MGFSDVFKSKFLENYDSVSAFDMIVAIVLAFCIGAFIFFIYKKTYSGVMYSSSFGTALIALTMISALVILAVTSNVVLSLGMVGALSIVRFRSAIKEPMDIAFLFWSVGAGIVLAAGMVPLAVFGSLSIGVMMLVFVNRKSNTSPYIAVIRSETQEVEQEAKMYLIDNTMKCLIKSKTVTKDLIECNYEVRLKNDDTNFINSLSNLKGIESVVLVSYNGDFMN